MLTDLLKRVARSLEDRAIPYMVVGGQAVLVHGEPRLTRDIDITLGVDTDSFELVQSLVGDLGLQSAVKNPKELVSTSLVYPVAAETGERIDFIFSSTPYERQAIRRAIETSFDDIKVAIASVEDTIIHKIFVGRPRDVEDVRGILKRQKNVDATYVKKWLNELAPASERDLVREFEVVLQSIQR